jgi:hypothetical protein
LILDLSIRRWILYPLPSDAQYALWVLEKRGEEGRTLKGSRTIKRARKESEKGKEKVRFSLAVLEPPLTSSQINEDSQ